MRIKKKSQVNSNTSRQETRKRLVSLEQLIKQGTIIVDQLTEIIADIKNVSVSKDAPFIFLSDIQENEKILRTILYDCGDVIFRKLNVGRRQALLIYVSGLTDTAMLEKNVVAELLNNEDFVTADAETIARELFSVTDLTIVESQQAAIDLLFSGKAMLLLSGIEKVFLFNSFKTEKRPVGNAENEDSILGPHDAFNETLGDNLSLIRRRSKDSHVKSVMYYIGSRTKTTVVLLYIDNLAKPELISEIKRRLQVVNTDKLLSASALEEQIIDRLWTPFPQIQHTERPDKVVAALYEGRISILVDNSPDALLLPTTYQTLMQSPDDYAASTLVASLTRATRFISSFIAVFLPAIYISIVSYHPGMLPTALTISIAEIRSKTPFPALLEAILMESLLEIFQEAITRLPLKIAGAAGVVGALVIGTTVVQAGMVNPLLVVVIAITGLASYSMANYKFAMMLRLFRVPILILGGVFGLYGVVIGFVMLVIHMCSLKSFGESFFGGTFDISLLRDWKDGMIRFPGSLIKYRPKHFGAQDSTKAAGVTTDEFRN